MTAITVRMKGADVARILSAAAVNAPKVLAQTVTAVAEQTSRAMEPVLLAQTGLKAGTIHRALKLIPASSGDLTARIWSAGGNISLRHFAPVETQPGVTAAPWGNRRLYPGTFTKAGWWPNRVSKPSWRGQVFRRAGGKTKTGKDRFVKVKSGEYIPVEMVKGHTIETFRSVSEAQLGPAVDAAMAKLLGSKS